MAQGVEAAVRLAEQVAATRWTVRSLIAIKSDTPVGNGDAVETEFVATLRRKLRLRKRRRSTS